MGEALDWNPTKGYLLAPSLPLLGVKDDRCGVSVRGVACGLLRTPVPDTVDVLVASTENLPTGSDA